MKLIDCIAGFVLFGMLFAVFVPAFLASNNAYLEDVRKIRAVNDAYITINALYKKNIVYIEKKFQHEILREQSGHFKLIHFKKVQSKNIKRYYALEFYLNGKEFTAYAEGIK